MSYVKSLCRTKPQSIQILITGVDNKNHHDQYYYRPLFSLGAVGARSERLCVPCGPYERPADEIMITRSAPRSRPHSQANRK